LHLIALFKGLNITLITTVGMLLVLSVALKGQEFWQPSNTSIENAQLILLAITAIFAAQFNRSRYSLLCFAWLLLMVVNQYHLAWSLWLVEHSDWLVLTFLALFTFLSTIKDRSLLSVHGFYRLIALFTCGVAAYIWLVMVNTLTIEINATHIFYKVIPYLQLILPALFCGLYLLFNSLLKKDLFQSSLLISFIIWLVYYFPLNDALIDLKLLIPWPLVIALLATQYLFAVIVDAYYLAYRDDLTSLPSRRALNQYALSLGRKYTVAMLDIDHFKKFNDTYGHDIGDQVLKLVASKLAKVKGGGRVFRYGGEEFTVVFSRKELTQSLHELEVLRQSIADYQIVIRQPQRSNKQSRKKAPKDNNSTVGVTISIGVAEHQTKQKFEQCLKMADQALYRAKANGRNNVSH
jgi:diguanylate cyclase (GGDEF)-like protein